MTKIIDDNLFIHRILLCSFIMATTRSAIRFVSRRFSNGKVLSEEEKAAENVFIKVNMLSLFTLPSGLESSVAICASTFPLVMMMKTL